MVLDPIGSGIAIKTEINMMKTSLTRKALVSHAVGLRARIERAPQRRAQRTMEAGIYLLLFMIALKFLNSQHSIY